MAIRGPRLEFAVGAFLLLSLASLLVLAIASTNGKFGFGGGNTYPLKARFSTIGQLRPSAPIKIGGVVVGSVADIQLDPVKYDSIVTLAIDNRYKDMPADTAAGIFTAGLLGESFISLQPGGDIETLKAGDEILLTQSAVDLMQLVVKYMFSGGPKPAEGEPAEGAAVASQAPETPAADATPTDPTPPSTEDTP
ncbi:MAG: outer membrane lipid asymmetry maintenance protein MlaD [Luteimonas sp.]